MLIPRLFPHQWEQSVKEIRSLMRSKTITDIRYTYELGIDFDDKPEPLLQPIVSGEGWQYFPITGGLGIFNKVMVPLRVVRAFHEFPICMCTDEWRRSSWLPFDMSDKTAQAFFDEVMTDVAETGFVEIIQNEPNTRMISTSLSFA